MKNNWDIRRKGRSWDPKGEIFTRNEMIPEGSHIEIHDGKLLFNDEDRLTLLAMLLENLGFDKITAHFKSYPKMFEQNISLADKNIGNLSELAKMARKDYESNLVVILKELQKSDAGVAAAALELWDNEVDAAEYIAKPARGLAGKSPLHAIEDGERQDVLDLIAKLKYGIY